VSAIHAPVNSGAPGFFTTTLKTDFQVRRVSCLEAREFVTKYHYAKGMHNGPTATFGLYDFDLLLGVCAFATPVSERVRASLFGEAHKSRVTELHRLVVLDWVPRNAESFFIARALHLLKDARPDLWGVISFADTSAGHVGTIYQASNAFWCGQSPSTPAYQDETGRIRHRRQCGVNISKDEALARGWKAIRTGVKHRYVLHLPDDRRHKRQLIEAFRLAPQRPYPKLGYTNGRAA
jgi:hypothetical protein